MEHWCLLTVIIHSFSFIHSFVCLFVRSFICKCNLFTHGALTFIKNSLKRVRVFQIELGFGAKKTGVPGEKPLGSRERPTTNSPHIWRRHQDSNPGHIGGRRALSPLRHPCSLEEKQAIQKRGGPSFPPALLFSPLLCQSRTQRGRCGGERSTHVL